MALVASPECGPCRRLPATLAELGLGHWQRQYDAGRHYLTTAAAVVARHVASARQAAALRRQIEDIQTMGQVPWIDVSRLGDLVVYLAPHGYIPAEVSGPRK
jgi:hypothetical protein